MHLNEFCKHAEDLCAILKHVGAKMQFYKKNMQINEFYKHVEDLCAILKYAGAKMQFYKENMLLNDAVHANEGPECKNQKTWGGNAMQ